MENHQFDAIIIGSGPAGEGAAMTAAKAGKTVAMIERHSDVGGGCTHWGTIPSTALRHSVQQLADYRSDSLFLEQSGELDLTYPELLRSAGKVIGKQVSMRRSFYARNRVKTITGHARLTDPNTVGVDNNGAGTRRYTAKNIVIATG